MLLKLILLFTLIPILELSLLVEFGRQFGLGATLVVVAATGILGAALAKSQGTSVIRRIQEEISAGRLPAEALFDGACIVTGGLLLLTPGLLTDGIGFVCLLPPTRKILKEWLKKKIQRRLEWQRTGFRGD